MKKSDAPAALADLLKKSRSLKPASGLTWHAWRDVVGSRVASRSVPRALDGQTLVVTVSSSAWAQELSFLSRTIRSKLAKEGYVVHALRFVVGTLRLPERAPAARRVERSPLPSELSARLERLDDPTLRELIAEAASYRRE